MTSAARDPKPADDAPPDPDHPGHAAERAGIVDQQAVALDQVRRAEEDDALDAMQDAGEEAGHTVTSQPPG